jgi:hypothetical protein
MLVLIAKPAATATATETATATKDLSPKQELILKKDAKQYEQL